MKIVRIDQLPLQNVSHNPAIKKRVMLQPGEVPHLTNFSQARFTPGQTASAHAHSDMLEVFFVEAGHGVIRINNTEHPLDPGVCAAVEPGEQHEITNTGSNELVITYFGITV